jgi:Domain of unknown function (DUF4129)
MNDSSAVASDSRLTDVISWSAWQELAALSLIAMEMTGTALWLRILSQTGLQISFRRAWGILVIIASVSYLLSRLLAILKIKIILRRGLILTWLLVCVYVGLRFFVIPGQPLGLTAAAGRIIQAIGQVSSVYPREIILALGILWIVQRGVSLAVNPFEYSVASGRFAAGVFWLGTYSLIAPFTGETPIMPIYLFILFGLLALGLARIYSLQFLRGSRKIPFAGSWLGGILGSVAVVVGLAVFTGFLMESWGAALTSRLLIGGLSVILIIGSILLLPVLAVLMQLIPLLQELMDQFPVIAKQILGVLAAIQGIFQRILAALEHDLRPPHVSGPAIVWSVLILSVLILLLTVRIRANRRRGSDLFESEELEELGVFKTFLGRLRSIQNRLGIRLGDRRIGQIWAKARIRRIYSQLISLCASLGLPRRLAQTPLEYLPMMQGSFPEGREDLAVITRAYLLVRYAELPESEQDLRDVENAWQRISDLGRRMKREQPKPKVNS